jgi:hypothetical protein
MTLLIHCPKNLYPYYILKYPTKNVFLCYNSIKIDRTSYDKAINEDDDKAYLGLYQNIRCSTCKKNIKIARVYSHCLCADQCPGFYEDYNVICYNCPKNKSRNCQTIYSEEYWLEGFYDMWEMAEVEKICENYTDIFYLKFADIDNIKLETPLNYKYKYSGFIAIKDKNTILNDKTILENNFHLCKKRKRKYTKKISLIKNVHNELLQKFTL